MNKGKYCHKYWQLDDANLRYCRDKGQHLKSLALTCVPVRARSAAPLGNILNAANADLGMFFFLSRQNGNDCVSRIDLGVFIQMGVDICCRSDCAMTKPCLNLFQTHSLSE